MMARCGRSGGGSRRRAEAAARRSGRSGAKVAVRAHALGPRIVNRLRRTGSERTHDSAALLARTCAGPRRIRRSWRFFARFFELSFEPLFGPFRPTSLDDARAR